MEETRSLRFGAASFTLISATRPSSDEGLLFDDGSLGGPRFDDTGLYFSPWPAATALCRHLAENPELCANRRVLELGAGAGAPSLLCASLPEPAEHVVATDLNEAVVERLERAFERNGIERARASARHADWDDVAGLLSLARAERIELVLAADVVYPAADMRPLMQALAALREASAETATATASTGAGGGTTIAALVAFSNRERETTNSFVRELRAIGPVETVGVYAEEDPLYGSSVPVHIYALLAAPSPSPPPSPPQSPPQPLPQPPRPSWADLGAGCGVVITVPR